MDGVEDHARACAPWHATGSGYLNLLTQQQDRANVSQYCEGDLGENQACYYKGLYFVISGVGTQGTGHVQFVEDAFDAVPAQWRLCGWHKNQRLFQLNTKSDETGYDIYDTCRAYGAIIATGHEHSYSRTYTMTSFVSQTIKDFNNTITLAPGQTTCFVSGLGGQSIREWDPALERNPWWAATGASNNGINYGALFCTFKVNGDPTRANCFYEDLDGERFDDFDIITTLPADKVVRSNDVCKQPFYEVAISNGADDAVENVRTGAVVAHQGTLRLGNPDLATSVITAFRFNDVPLERNARVHQAQVQVFGRTVDTTISPVLNVRVEVTGNAAPIDATVPHAITQRHLSAAVQWTTDGEDFERHSVWGTADISGLINELVARNDWEFGNSILVTVEGHASMIVSSFDRSECQAPTLSLELARTC